VESHLEKERLINDILRVSVESIDFEDIGGKILPLLERLLRTSGTLFYRCDDEGQMVPMAGSISEVAKEYRDHYLKLDPLQTGLRRQNFKLQRAAGLPEWADYIKGPVYNECTRPNKIDDFFHMILQGDKFQGPDMVGIMLARDHRQPEFSESDGLILARILPSLETLMQRCTRLENRLSSLNCLETALESNHPYALLFNTRGKVTWASSEASCLLNFQRKSGNNFLDPLTQAVKDLGQKINQEGPFPPPSTSVEIPQEEGSPINAELRIVRTKSGEPFIFVELDSALQSPLLKKTAARYNLSAAETEVLKLLSLGMSDREISKRLFITLATVRTHVGRILAKLGVRSRVQAALRVYGVQPDQV
jgi:DNA-binding CsgD family transcriptional regulator